MLRVRARTLPEMAPALLFDSPSPLPATKTCQSPLQQGSISSWKVMASVLPSTDNSTALGGRVSAVRFPTAGWMKGSASLPDRASSLPGQPGDCPQPPDWPDPPLAPLYPPELGAVRRSRTSWPSVHVRPELFQTACLSLSERVASAMSNSTSSTWSVQFRGIAGFT